MKPHHAPLLALILAGLAPLAGGQAATVQFVTFIPGRPVVVTAPPGESARVFVVDKFGRIRIVQGGSLLPTSFLDWSAHIDASGEGGLLGLAFHPDYATSGQLYISYTAPFQGGASVISQLTVDPNDPNQADPTSEQIIWGPYPQQFQSHKAGDLHFGPDGKLFFSIGDGTDGGTLEDNAQDLSDSRGSILRFDVDLPSPHIPPDNPFVGDPAANDEIWAYGLRNPWRFCIDPLNGDLYTGDVGATGWEEINWLPGTHTGGGNFAWPCKEGPDCLSSVFCDCQDPALVDPIHAYDHSVGCAVIGGEVYRGSLIPSLYGHYLFADFCTHRIWSFRWDGQAIQDFTDLSSDLLAGNGGAENTFPVAFGADGVGELYLLNYHSTKLFKIVPVCSGESYCSSSANSSGQPALISAGGSFSVSENALVLSAAQLPKKKFGFFMFGDDQAFVPGFGGSQGTLCLSSPIRLAKHVQFSGASGAVSFSPNLNKLPQKTIVLPGQTWNFQYWTRDRNPTPTSNTTDGVAVLFCP